MEYKVYKMIFPNGVHIGKTSLEESEYSFHADTIFSALCQEAVKNDVECLKQLCRYAKSGQLLISDAFPYIGDCYYIPKPMIRIETEKQGDSKLKKAYKKLSYIPAHLLGKYLSGELDVCEEQNKFKQLGTAYTKTSASVMGEKETTPYRVGIYQFYEGNGLYVIVGYEKAEQLELTKQLFQSLSYSGIGGKRSSGLGRFQVCEVELIGDIQQRLVRKGERYMTLSVSLPQEQEMENALQQASYQIIKRSGFVASYVYADSFHRKNDLYVMNAGSCFVQQYQGDIYDVSSGGSHAVYRYAQPMFLEVSI